MAEGFEIGILVGEFFEVVVEFDRPADVGLGGGEVSPLGGIATEVELDEGICGVEAGSIGQNFGCGFDRIASSFRKGPGDEPTGLVGVTGGKSGGESCGVLPATGTFQKAKFKFLNTIIGDHLGGEILEFG